MIEELRHLTWRGRLSMAYYAARRLFVDPAPSDDRCVMGYPLGEHVHCPRRAVGDELWCARHVPDRRPE